MLDYGAKFEEGFGYHEFLAKYGTDEQRRRWEMLHEKVTLTTAQRALLAGFTREMKLLCLTGAWCGDCVNQCPIFDHFAIVNPKIRLRFFDRDANPDLGESLAVCGGARVPVVLFVSEDNHQVAWYGDRTLSKYRRIAAEQLTSEQLGAACPTGLVPDDQSLLAAVTQDWLDEFERVHWILRTSSRLRKLHSD
ncbi:MAG: thiol reductase thioredoxin [Planctomycetaceae bacterium]|nr:thiol reductase thioredoxin [Planctomycetaceae bacterium]